MRLKLLQLSDMSDEERFEKAYQIFKQKLTQLILELEFLPLGPERSHIFPTEFTEPFWKIKLLKNCSERYMKERVTDLKVFVTNATGVVGVNWIPETV